MRDSIEIHDPARSNSVLTMLNTRVSAGVLAVSLLLNGCSTKFEIKTEGLQQVEVVEIDEPIEQPTVGSIPSATETPIEIEELPTQTDVEEDSMKEDQEEDQQVDVVAERVGSTNTIARGIGNLETRIGHRVFDESMLFFGISNNVDQQSEALSWHPAALNQLNSVELPPTIIIEHQGVGLDSVNHENTAEYFRKLAERGVEDNQIGRAVIFPEYIVGGWQGNNPDAFVDGVVNTAAALHQSFPNAEATTLVDHDSVESNEMVPVIRDGNERLREAGITSVGVQAFANSTQITFNDRGEADLSGYLDVEGVTQIADALGVKNIWLNTGFIKKDLRMGSEYTTEQRIAIAVATAEVILELQYMGYIIDSVNIFGQNKLNEGEGRDFSFDEPGEEVIIEEFARFMEDAGVSLSGFMLG